MYEIFDLHNDYYLNIASDKKKSDYVKNKSKCAKNIVSAIWTSELSPDESMSQIESALNFVNQNDKLFLSVEDLHFLNNNNLDKFLKTKPLYAGLTWNRSNCLGGGAKEGGTLTPFGKSVAKRLENLNIKIDTAHLNEDTFGEICKSSSKPIFCSHTAFFGINENERNLKDYQLKIIADSGGLVGLCFVSDFLNGKKKCEIGDIVRHIDYFACKFGIKNLALGTDFYGTNHLPCGIKNYDDVSQKLSLALEKMGYTSKAIENIFYNNAHNFFYKSV